MKYLSRRGRFAKLSKKRKEELIDMVVLECGSVAYASRKLSIPYKLARSVVYEYRSRKGISVKKGTRQKAIKVEEDPEVKKEPDSPRIEPQQSNPQAGPKIGEQGQLPIQKHEQFQNHCLGPYLVYPYWPINALNTYQ